MNKPSDQAFPMYGPGREGSGLTKRELFAAFALQGILAGAALNEAKPDLDVKGLAKEAVKVADALQNALDKGTA